MPPKTENHVSYAYKIVLNHSVSEPEHTTAQRNHSLSFKEEKVEHEKNLFKRLKNKIFEFFGFLAKCIGLSSDPIELLFSQNPYLSDVMLVNSLQYRLLSLDIHLVEKFVASKNISLNTPDPWNSEAQNHTLLQRLLLQKDYHACNVLIGRNPPNRKNLIQALELLVQKGDYEGLVFLLANSQCNTTHLRMYLESSPAHNLLKCALDKQDIRIMCLLLQHCVNSRLQDPSGETLLQRIQVLVNQLNSKRVTLHTELQRKKLEIIKKSILFHQNPQEQKTKSEELLTLIRNDDLDKFQAAVREGSYVHEMLVMEDGTVKQTTALILAIREGAKKIANYISTSYPECISMFDQDGRNAASYAWDRYCNDRSIEKKQIFQRLVFPDDEVYFYDINFLKEMVLQKEWHLFCELLQKYVNREVKITSSFEDDLVPSYVDNSEDRQNKAFAMLRELESLQNGNKPQYVKPPDDNYEKIIRIVIRAKLARFLMKELDSVRDIDSPQKGYYEALSLVIDVLPQTKFANSFWKRIAAQVEREPELKKCISMNKTRL